MARASEPRRSNDPMQASMLVNAKWRTHPLTTGVQRYASGLTAALRDSGTVLETASPRPGPPWKTTLWEQRTLPRLARSYDLLLCPANAGPYRLDPETRLVLTLHCLRFRTHPENYTRSFVRWYEHLIPRLVRRADAILTVSRTAADEIAEAFPLARGKLHAVAPGIDSAFSPHHGRDPLVGEEPYCVFVGNAAPAKNLRTLLRALERTRSPMRLVLLGVDQSQCRLICPDSISHRVLALGHVNDSARVASVMAHASALLAPSLYESFDLPTVEAMACACPVIASDLAVHREVCADAARFILPTDPDAWARAIDRLDDPCESRPYIERGLSRSARFLWARAASEVSGIVEGLCGVTQA